jgi:hypothetical protein
MAHSVSLFVKPEGLAATLLGVTLAMTIICPVVIAGRVYVRVRTRCFGDDDYLMCVALASLSSRFELPFVSLLTMTQLVNLAHNGVVIRGAWNCLGTYDSRLSDELMTEGRKVCDDSFSKSSLISQLMSAVPVSLADHVCVGSRLHQDKHLDHAQTNRHPPSASIPHMGPHSFIKPYKHRGTCLSSPYM